MLTKVIEQAKIDHFTKWFERADKIVIVSHVSPDGDAIGSSLGLYHFLDSQEKTVNVIVPNAFPDFLRWMPGSKDILLYDRYKDFADKLIAEADVICCLDFNALKRIDDMADAVAASPAGSWGWSGWFAGSPSRPPRCGRRLGWRHGRTRRPGTPAPRTGRPP